MTTTKDTARPETRPTEREKLLGAGRAVRKTQQFDANAVNGSFPRFCVCAGISSATSIASTAVPNTHGGHTMANKGTET